MIPYRREIDGLRALAVVPVVLFHAGVERFSGGFVGVDVFFVISGYLITSILLKQLDAGTFSFAAFYERRARRILPALFLVVACSMVVAWFALIPPDMEDFARSLSYIPVFLTNVFFYRESDYFATGAEWMPLLHTWSLAVEEQYYLLFPLLLWFLWRRGRAGIPWVFLVIALASLMASEWMIGRDAPAAFFLLQFRLWELLAGAGVAWLHARRGGPGVCSGALAGAGVLLILASVFAFDASTRFPGLHALLPVAGAVLVVMHAGPGNLAGRILGWGPCVGIGLISYSAYLWHQPLLAFVRHLSFEPPSQAALLIAAGASFVLAYPSWRFVEQPFRRPGGVTRRALVGTLAVASVVVIAFGSGGRVTEGYDRRAGFGERFPDMNARLERNYGLARYCAATEKRQPECATDERPEILLWGDSYAMHLVKGLVADNPDIRMVQFTKSACGPVLGAAPVRGHPDDREWIEECLAHNEAAIRALEAADSVRHVVIGSWFYYYFEPGRTIQLVDGSRVSGGERGVELLQATIDRVRAAGKRVTVFAPTPTEGGRRDYGRCVVRAVWLREPLEACEFPRSAWEQAHPGTVASLRALEQASIPVVWLADGICPDGTCKPVIDDVVIYRDGGHLSKEGSEYLGRTMGWYRQVTETAP